MNSATQCRRRLQFLRPYASRSLLCRNAVYLRFYDLAQSTAPCLQRRNLASTKTKATTELLAEEDAVQNRSAFIVSRLKELADVEKLKYPRLRHASVPMRIPVFRERFKDVTIDAPAEEEVVVHGRLQFVRRASSKLVFLDLTQDFEHVQGLCNFRKLDGQGSVNPEQFKDLFRLLKRGDLVSVTGTAIRTPTGELTIEATRLPQLLAPSLVPLPTKLADDDTRIQHRHIDLLVNRQTADTLRLRSYIIKYMRDFFHEKGFLEFQTPIIADNAGGAIARPFATRSTEFPSRELALRIAPELWLKRLVVGGVDKVFEIGPAFRNEGLDATHNPEFTMCEFYESYANLDDLIAATEDLIRGLAHHCAGMISSKLVSLPAIDLDAYAGRFAQLEFIPALEDALGFRLPDLESETATAELLSLLVKHDITAGASGPLPTSLPKLLDRLAGLFLEPRSALAPIFLTHHPACMSPLAKTFRCTATGQVVSARAELFVGGRELANMYEEENDPFAQRRKLAAQARQRDRDCSRPDHSRTEEVVDDGDAPVVDESYVQVLESGLPPTGGWGCGVERLVMLFSGVPRISDCLSFGSLRNVVGLSAGTRKGA